MATGGSTGSLPQPPSAPIRRWRWTPLAASVTVVGVAIALTVSWLFFTARPERPAASPPRDPRRDYTGPFRNVHPDVRYVSDQRCAGCHREISESYTHHPMGYSVLPVSQAASPPEDRGHSNPFQALGSIFQVERAGRQLRHRRSQLDPHGKPAAELAWDVHFVVGSGQRGYSYLTDREGYVFQTPLSWYSQKKTWALSPGFDASLLVGRPVIPECLFCHANRANHHEGSVNRYGPPVFDGPAIGCQRCHGPGELHVTNREKREPIRGDIDYTIVNPRHLVWNLREAVCEQCHLPGQTRTLRRGRGLYDFRPGLPFDAFWSVFVHSENEDGQKAVSHVEQMYQSRCFQESKGRLGCISCHDPHRTVRGPERMTYYRQRCLTCHAPEPEDRVQRWKGCSESVEGRRQKQDSCIDCHMKPFGAADIPHTAATNHRILLRPVARSGVRAGRASGAGVVSFYRDRRGADAIDEDRDLALAVITRAGESSLSDIAHARRGLETSLQRDPDDLPAAVARGYALGLENRWNEALTGFQQILGKAPNRELALVGAASMAESLGQTDVAQTYWRRAIGANPWSPEYRRQLVLLLVKQRAWHEAEPECQTWLWLDPMSAEARAAHVACLVAAGKKDEARAEFARIEALAPSNLTELRLRFERKLK
jgi:hypothetical protein